MPGKTGIRSFVAVELTDAVRLALAAVQRNLKAIVAAPELVSIAAGNGVMLQHEHAFAGLGQITGCAQAAQPCTNHDDVEFLCHAASTSMLPYSSGRRCSRLSTA